MSHWSDPAVIAAISGVAVALLYTLLTGFIWHATWQNTKATKDILEAAHRPYLGIANIEVVMPKFHGGEIRISAAIENVGAVPSRRIEIEFSITYPDGDTDKGRSGHPHVSLFPHQSFSHSVTLPPERHSLISQGTFDTAVAVRYQGMTDKQYATYGTYKYGGILSGFSVISGHFE